MDHNFEKYVSPNMVNLTDKYAIKILICYFLSKLDNPITKGQLTEIATDDGILNYFLYVEAFDELVEVGLLIVNNVDGSEYIELSEVARESSEEFKGVVPKSFRDKILSAGIKFFAHLKAKNVSVEIAEEDKGAAVSFRTNDRGAELMNLSLYLPDRSQAELVKERIEADPAGFYSRIIDFATGE